MAVHAMGDEQPDAERDQKVRGRSDVPMKRQEIMRLHSWREVLEHALERGEVGWCAAVWCVDAW